MSFKTSMKWSDGSANSERQRQRIPDKMSSKRKSTLTTSRLYKGHMQQVLLKVEERKLREASIGNKKMSKIRGLFRMQSDKNKRSKFYIQYKVW